MDSVIFSCRVVLSESTGCHDVYFFNDSCEYLAGSFEELSEAVKCIRSYLDNILKFESDFMKVFENMKNTKNFRSENCDGCQCDDCGECSSANCDICYRAEFANEDYEDMFYVAGNVKNCDLD